MLAMADRFHYHQTKFTLTITLKANNTISGVNSKKFSKWYKKHCFIKDSIDNMCKNYTS